MGSKIISFLFLVFILSCQNKVKEYTQQAIYIIQPTGIPFSNSNFLASPLTHGVMINPQGDSLNVLVIANNTLQERMEVLPLGAFKIGAENKNESQYILALPKDTLLQSIKPVSYEDFVVKMNAAKVLIDQYYSNYKGLGKTRIYEWQNTIMAEKIIEDFWNK